MAINIGKSMSDGSYIRGIWRQGFYKQRTRGVLIGHILFWEIFISLTMVFLVNGVFAFIGVPLFIMDAFFYIHYLELWKSRGYSTKLLNAVTFVNIVLTLIFSARIAGSLFTLIDYFIHL